MTYTDRLIKWLIDRDNQILLVTYATAISQAIAAQTGWRWATVTSKVLSCLPGFNLPGLATAARKESK
jgi:hypothetical protein